MLSLSVRRGVVQTNGAMVRGRKLAGLRRVGRSYSTTVRFGPGVAWVGTYVADRSRP
jgi:hypothetical protein